MMANRLPAEIFQVPFDLGSVIEIVDAATWLEPEFGDSKADYETRAQEASELWKLIESNELTDDIVESNFADWASVLYYQEAEDDDPLEIPREFTRAVIAGDAAKLTKLLAHYEFHGALLGDEITRLAAYLAPDRMVNVRPHGDLVAAVSSQGRNVDWGRAYIEGGVTLAKAIQAKGLSRAVRNQGRGGSAGMIDVFTPIADRLAADAAGKRRGRESSEGPQTPVFCASRRRHRRRSSLDRLRGVRFRRSVAPQAARW